MGTKVAESSDLFDDVTGRWVGVVDLLGREQLLSNTPVPAPHPGYIFCSAGNQIATSGSAKNAARYNDTLAEMYPSVLTGNGTLTDAQMWANAGWMTSTTGTGGSIILPLPAFAPNLKGKTILLAVNIKAAAPGSTTNFAGQGNGATGAQGFGLQAVVTSGKVNLTYVTAAGTFSTAAATTGVYFDNTEHAMLFCLHPSGLAVFFRDGYLDTKYSPNDATPLGVSTPTEAFALGGAAGTSVASIAGQYRNIHLLSLDFIPTNLDEIAKKLALSPFRPLTTADIVSPAKTVALGFVPGQSNEVGNGNTPNMTGARGVPWIDASGRGVQASINTRLALRDTASIWVETAFGGTAIADSWVGRIRAWVPGLNVVTGSYVTNLNVMYKCTNTIGFSGQSNTTPAVGTGADGVTWASAGAVTAADNAIVFAGGICDSTSPRWDPNGLMATANAKFALTVVNCPERIAIISIGQTDRFVGTTRAQFSTAIQRAALALLAGSVTKVLVGMTIRTTDVTSYTSANGGGAANAANTTSDAWYDAALIPGRLDALAALAKLKVNAFPGHDWATDIGPLTDQALPINPGIQTANKPHATDALYERSMVPLLDRALMSIGV